MNRVARAMARVLTLGTPRPMRRLMSEQDAANRARKHVRDMMLSNDLHVAVPDFNVLVLKSEDRPHRATVLHSGERIGTLLRTRRGAVIFRGLGIETGNAGVDAAIRNGINSLVKRLITTNVRWPDNTTIAA